MSRPRIICDLRERAGGIPLTLMLHDIEVVEDTLPVGDYVISDRLCVERKTEADLWASVKDGRLFDQVSRLTDAYERVVLLVTVYGQLDDRLRGPLAWAARRGVSVVLAQSEDDTVGWIVTLTRQEQGTPSAPRGAKRRKPRPDRLAEEMLCALPGVGPRLARDLLARFGTLQAVADADEKQLRETPRVGKARAAALAAVFRLDHHDAPWEA